MNAWLIYNQKDIQKNDSFIKWFIKEAALLHIQLTLVTRERMYIGIEEQSFVIYVNRQKQTHPDFVISRTRSGHLHEQFELMGIPVFNNSKIAHMCNHKALTYMEMKNIGVPVLNSHFTHNQVADFNLPSPLPWVIKDAQGHGGTGVSIIDNKEKQMDYKNVTNDLVIQSTTSIQFGIDVRVFIVGNEIVAAIKRENRQDFRANYTLGGEATVFTLTTQMIQQVKEIMNHYTFDMVGIDFLVDDANELVFNEIEDVVGSRTLSAHTNINIVRLFLQHIMKVI